MLGPIVALLLLTSPAAPVAQQSCWFLCPSTETSGSSMGSRWAEEQRRYDVEDRLRRVENELSQRRYEELTRPSPGLTLPSSPSLGSGSSSSGTCSLLCAAGFR